MSNQQTEENVPLEYEGITGPYFRPNTMYCGDNLEVLKQIPEESIDLIYLDPPFYTNREFLWDEKSKDEKRAFDDRWAGKIDNYTDWMKERLLECRRVLKDTGTIYLHCDHHVNANLRLLMDKKDMFGPSNFRNEIIWCYTGPSANSRDFPRKHDMILRYSKTNKYYSNLDSIRVPYKTSNPLSRGHGQIWDRGSIGTQEEYLQRGKLPEDYWLDCDYWTDIHSGGQISVNERVGYPTLKPLKLLKRIILASSKEGDLVLDPFCGSGTTLVAATELGRKWIGIDVSQTAIRNVAARRLSKHKPAPIKYNINSIPTIKDLLSFNHYDFQNWVVKVLRGRISPRLSGDMGIDGYDSDGNPVQVKQDDVGRNVVDNFETAIKRAKKTTGTIVGCSFASGAIEEIARAKLEDGLIIHHLTLEEFIIKYQITVLDGFWQRQQQTLTSTYG